MKFNGVIIFLFLLFLFPCCEKNISFKINHAAPKLVVEAIIENNMPPVVYLSTSTDYFSRINPQILANSFVHQADVYISNGTLTHKLKEYTVPVGPGFNIYYYSIDSSSLTTAFLGQLNTHYSLRVISGGKEYDAVTDIPRITRRIDSLYWQPAPAGNDSNKVSLMLKAYDPPGYGDYIRYFTKRNSEPFWPGFNSVFDDQIIDGTEYTVEVERGVDRNVSTTDDNPFFLRGDTVTLKLCNINKATFDFWRTMEFTYQTAGNPFSSPAKVLSNISGDALGYFGGYAAQYRTIIIPR